MQLFPAVVIGGPPDSGKSTLTYHLSQALRRLGVQHYVLRTAPDGEGDWSNEANQDLVRTILTPQVWTTAFVEYICHSLAQRHLPLIVDVGGRPTSWQEIIFDHCTHAVLLTPDETSRATWHGLIARHSLLLVADLRSELAGTSQITATSPTLVGTLSALRRGGQLSGPPFEILVERLERLFDYDSDQLRRHHLASAPIETTVDLDRLAQVLKISLAGQKAIWQPDHLPGLLDYLPQGQPLGLYGRGPNWLYAAVALQTYPAPFYQFDVRLGWVRPPELRLGMPSPDAPLQMTHQARGDFVDVTFSIPNGHVDYTNVTGMLVPPLPAGLGVALSGKLPHWLITALALVYRERPLLAVYQPQVGQVVVHSHLPELKPGDVLASCS